jgi:hypothetical protein
VSLSISVSNDFTANLGVHLDLGEAFGGGADNDPRVTQVGVDASRGAGVASTAGAT